MSDALGQASPQTGLFIPAEPGRRVLYGHPFETVGAEGMRAEVEGFYTRVDSAGAAALLAEHGVDYVFFGPREAALGDLPQVDGLFLVYAQDEVWIYEVRP